jgi:hypothetical protein
MGTADRASRYATLGNKRGVFYKYQTKEEENLHAIQALAVNLSTTLSRVGVSMPVVNVTTFWDSLRKRRKSRVVVVRLSIVTVMV